MATTDEGPWFADPDPAAKPKRPTVTDHLLSLRMVKNGARAEIIDPRMRGLNRKQRRAIALGRTTRAGFTPAVAQAYAIMQHNAKERL